MYHKGGNFFGLLLVALVIVAVLALFASEPEITGLVVQEFPPKSAGIVQGNSCSGLLHGSCSNTKPLYCSDGQLVYNCYECGCDEGMTCGQFGVCEPLRTCADGSYYDECAFLKGKFCRNGKLTDNCGLCGCEEGKACQDGKCVREFLFPIDE